MKTRLWLRKGCFLALAVAICAPVSLVGIHPQEAGKPYSKDEIVGLLKGQVAPRRVAALARQRGIDFQITAEIEGELRRAGASNALLATLRELTPKSAVPVIERPRGVTPAAEIAPGAVKTNPKDGLNYVWIPAGGFMMGCSPGDSECYDNEKPSHQVTISKGFWLGQTPVTVAAYWRYAGATGKAMPEAPDFNSGWSNQEMPIVNVSWEDSVAYCSWAGGRLPTEAEWEYAARAGSADARYGPIDEVAWYSRNSGGQTREVARKRSNAFKLYDMLGNVWEWVSDWYGENYYSPTPQRDPQGPSTGQYRVLRGGSWDGDPGIVRASNYGGNYPGFSSDSGGFRCVGEVKAP